MVFFSFVCEASRALLVEWWIFWRKARAYFEAFFFYHPLF